MGVAHNSEGRSLEIYDGREKVGTLRASGVVWIAFDAADRCVGRFVDLAAARAAVMRPPAVIAKAT